MNEERIHTQKESIEMLPTLETGSQVGTCRLSQLETEDKVLFAQLHR